MLARIVTIPILLAWSRRRSRICWPIPIAGVLWRDEIGDLRRPGKSWKWGVRAQTSKADDFAAHIFGYEERIALVKFKKDWKNSFGTLLSG